ncbi:MAG: hypothetical protein ACFB0B_20470 [Thermonemataceae bacterium]
MKPFLYYGLIVSVLFTYIRCGEKSRAANQTAIKSEKIAPVPQDFSTVKITLKRGAFHYDAFILEDTVLTFYPEKELDNGDKYYQKSVHSISKAERDQLIKKILAADIWQLKEQYTTERSCTSGTEVHFALDGKEKIVTCQDCGSSCPEILRFIENELVRLHGKDLKRIYLPG